MYTFETEEWKCSGCGAWSDEEAWRGNDASYPCSDCGDHGAAVCPACGVSWEAMYFEPADTRPLLPDLLPLTL